MSEPRTAATVARALSRARRRMGVRHALPADFEDGTLATMFAAAFAHFEACAGRPLLRPDAFTHWAKGYERVAERSRLVVVGDIDGAPAAFAEGLLRTPPAYYAPELFGYVNVTYVDPAARGSGHALLLVHTLAQWFRARGATHFGGTVVEGNAALATWHRAGFENEATHVRASVDAWLAPHE